MNRHLILVYGTLRRDGSNAIERRFPGSRFVGRAEVAGRLYDLGEYPALLQGDQASLVVGEVYEVDDFTLRSLDEFEATADYVRRKATVNLGGDATHCWFYGPEPESCEGKQSIESGDWIEYVRRGEEVSSQSPKDRESE